MKFLILLILPLGFLVIRTGLRYRQRGRRARAFSSEFPHEWQHVLHDNIPLYRRLPHDLQPQLHRHINVFLAEKTFIGRGGLEITDEIRVTIAGQACLLLLNREATYFPSLRTIFVFPSAYIVTDQIDDDSDIVGEQVRLGESWDDGPVALAWDAVLHGSDDERDGHNVVLHEFAHQLDQEYGSADGAPNLGERSRFASWARVLSREYEILRRRAGRGHRAVLDGYGATNPAEFFAVATETFFEKGRRMQREHPELYDELKGFFCVDPASWR